MEKFKCKNCGSDKYKQISVMTKQCLDCGRQELSEGIMERSEEEIPELKLGNGIFDQLTVHRNNLHEDIVKEYEYWMQRLRILGY